MEEDKMKVGWKPEHDLKNARKQYNAGKRKGKIVKKSWVSRLETKKIPQVNKSKDGEGGTMNVDSGENSKQKNTSDEQPPENNQISEKYGARKGTSILLKAEGKIVKKSHNSRLKTKNKKKSGVNEGEHGVGGGRNMNTAENSKQERTSDELPPKNHIAENNEMEVSEQGKVDDPKKNSIAKSQSEKGKALELQRGQQKQNKVKYLRFQKNNQGDKESQDGKGRNQTNETRKERLGGLIFMCNGKTKPDCFHYRIMGVSNQNKDFVLGIKPGIKLFLFDFDLKILYGIYSASSSGGMKLEPKAFGGAFPVQVRFNIDKDCFPLPESIFKKAIKENYDKKNRFKTELTVKQVGKLIQLFRPVGIHYSKPAPSPQSITIWDNAIQDGIRGAQANLRRDALDLDHHVDADVKSHNVLSHSRDIVVSNQDARLAWREEIPRDLFITEKEYRAYGLNGKGRNVTPSSSVNPARLETRHYDHLPSYDKEYRAYVHELPSPHNLPSSIVAVGGTPVSTFTDNHHYANRYGTSSAETLLHPLREGIASSSLVAGGRRVIEVDNLGWTETVQDRLYLRYAADTLVDYNQTPLNSSTHPASLPISSRYSFADHSYLYR